MLQHMVNQGLKCEISVGGRSDSGIDSLGNLVEIPLAKWSWPDC